MVTSLRRVRVGEDQQVFSGDVVFGIHVDEACHTDRFLQGTAVRRMFVPGLAQVAGGGYGTASAPVVTHVQHQDARFDFGNLRLGRVGACQVMQMPGGSPVFAVHDAGVRYAGGIDELDRENQCPVFHRDPPARSLQQEVPGRIFHLRSDIDRLAPGLAVVFAFDKHQLGGTVGRHARHGIPPGTPVPHAVRPGGNDPDRICLFVH